MDIEDIDWSLMKGEQGIYRTQSLFKELKNPKYPYFFNLSEQDAPDSISLKKRYMAIADPTEYKFAIKMFGNFTHWKKLCGLTWFKPLVEEWRAELATKIESESISRLQELSQEPGQIGLSATRSTLSYIKERGKEKESEEQKRGRGRPRKQDTVVDHDPQILEDLLRLEI